MSAYNEIYNSSRYLRFMLSYCILTIIFFSPLLSVRRRVRILPPIDERMYNTMMQYVVAVLDPFPVGMHVPIMDAMIAGIPVVSTHHRL